MDRIGMTFLDSPPDGLPQVTERDRHCAFLGRARRGEAFFVATDDMVCPMARFYMGMGQSIEELAGLLVQWAARPDVSSARTYLDAEPVMQGGYHCVAYFPVGGADLEPDLIIAVCTPAEAQQAVRAYLARTGSGIRGKIGALGAACGECVAQVMLSGEPALSLGCGGSRPRIPLADGEMLMSAPRGNVLYEIMLGSS